ncbi:MMPL family transporter [Frankia sp. AgPm24]|uniref:MMPL family transporter n=1 Tax=Frankia sp. AgPm24 TaxID=631128 RepID=UPI00200FF978|nr:MMPL family transporter [Frankia sp. AgPm24]MCK9923028.1 MMPL family transporter [Frankia sp. AgPm24]
MLRRRQVLALALLALIGLLGTRVAVGAQLSGGGFVPPDSESARAADVLEQRFAVVATGLVLVVGSRSGDVDAPVVSAAAARLTERLAAEPGVRSVTSYWSARAATLRSGDGRYALVLATLDGDDPTRNDRAGALAGQLRGADGPITVGVTGQDVVAAETDERISADLLRAELVAFPAMMLLLGLFLRRVRLALVPVLVGMLAVVGGVAVVGLLAVVTDMSTFTTNIVVGLGLGLSIDYALLVIYRYREELGGPTAPRDPTGTGTGLTRESRDAALARAWAASGRTVGFSAATVAVSLLGLAVFPIPFLRSMALAGVAATVFAAVLSLLVLPAVLAAFGAGVLPRRRPAGERHTTLPAHSAWYRLARLVGRRPLLWGGAVTAVLVVLALPLGGVSLGVNDDRNLPASSESRQAAEILRTGFDGRESSPLRVVATGTARAAGTDQSLSDYAVALSEVRGVTRVDGPTGTFADGVRAGEPTAATSRQRAGDAAFWTVIPAVEPISAAGERLVADLRAVPSPFTVRVGGPAADHVDTYDTLMSRLPYAAGFIAVVTFLALLAMFGSVVIPLQALMVNLLSLSATFGVLVWVFQDGHLSGPLDFTATGSIPAAMPVLVFCVAFGVSMDYGVFLLARIKEHHDRTGDHAGAILHGIDRTGAIVTFAALLLATVFAGFVTSSVTAIKLLGFGLALAVLLDACVVRGVLVPAVLRLCGRATWWAPRPLRRPHAHPAPEPHVPRVGTG